jgi:hypothetical protein
MTRTSVNPGEARAVRADGGRQLHDEQHPLHGHLPGGVLSRQQGDGAALASGRRGHLEALHQALGRVEDARVALAKALRRLEGAGSCG